MDKQEPGWLRTFMDILSDTVHLDNPFKALQEQCRVRAEDTYTDMTESNLKLHISSQES